MLERLRARSAGESGIGGQFGDGPVGRRGATWRYGELRSACDSDARFPRTRNWHLARTRDRGLRVRARVTCRFDGRAATGPLNGGRARSSSRARMQGPFSVRASSARPGDRVRRLHCLSSERHAVPGRGAAAAEARGLGGCESVLVRPEIRGAAPKRRESIRPGKRRTYVRVTCPATRLVGSFSSSRRVIADVRDVHDFESAASLSACTELGLDRQPAALVLLVDRTGKGGRCPEKSIDRLGRRQRPGTVPVLLRTWGSHEDTKLLEPLEPPVYGGLAGVSDESDQFVFDHRSLGGEMEDEGRARMGHRVEYLFRPSVHALFIFA
jgi:hypothetical protein